MAVSMVVMMVALTARTMADLKVALLEIMSVVTKV